ncbi:MAG TPA: hypothetical protein DHV38_02890 [Corynebacterium casei]|uniref:hypothetical protein n=1 Tax=Corynebacterium casei TaxID=160386 RepID=UPI000ED18EE0|nr:hypothetical protein [Corynebacterium casei]HCJ68369.1 hypothetical protein [Corynebacterium casei]
MPDYQALESKHLQEPPSQPAHDDDIINGLVERHTQGKEEETMQEYTPLDSLTYLNRSVSSQLEVVADLIYEGEELPENLQNAVSMLDSIRNEIRNEAEHHGAARAAHYSNGVPTSTRFNDVPTSDPDGETYLPEVHTDVHPSGNVRVLSTPTSKEV